MSDLVIFEDDTRQVEVRLEGETLWLSLQQLADLFARDKSVISRHLKNIFDGNELERRSVVAKSATTAADGKTYQVDFYNLDAIIPVGYRVNSTRATRFRQWATRVLREHLTQGYSLNEHRLSELGVAELEQAVHLLGKTLIRQELVSGGNKRSAAFLFLLYLRQEGMRLTLDENGMTALTLLIAESDPKAKDLMVRLVMHLLPSGALKSALSLIDAGSLECTQAFSTSPRIVVSQAEPTVLATTLAE